MEIRAWGFHSQCSHNLKQPTGSGRLWHVVELALSSFGKCKTLKLLWVQRLFLMSWPLALTPHLKFGEQIASESSYHCGHRRRHSLSELPSNRIWGIWEQRNSGLKWDYATVFENHHAFQIKCITQMSASHTYLVRNILPKNFSVNHLYWCPELGIKLPK